LERRGLLVRKAKEANKVNLGIKVLRAKGVKGDFKGLRD
jgi:hypothetical protein